MRTNTARLPRLLLIMVPALILILSGCPEPIDINTAAQLTDSSPPSLLLSTPANNSTYTQTVTIIGTVRDAGGKIKSLHYTVSGVLGVLTSGTVGAEHIQSDGSFTFSFSTVDFSGPIVIQLEAFDWNDNQVSTSLTLEYSGSSLSSFSAVPGNKSIELNWEPVPAASGYTVYYTDNGTLPGDGFGTAVNVSGNSHLLENLRNGALYTFLLRAEIPGEEPYFSSYRQTIPLSQFTLAPRVNGEYRKIELEWPAIEGSNTFTIYRATTPDGTYTNYTGTIVGNRFTDTAVSNGQWYYYRIKPTLEGTLLSSFNGGVPFQVPTISDQISSVATPSASQKVAVGGDYAYIASGANGVIVADISIPTAPSVITTFATTDARDLFFLNDRLYIADGTSGLRILDVSTPSTPSQLSLYTGSIGNAKAVEVSATGRAFLLDSSGDTTVWILDVSDPASVTQRAFYTDATETISDVAIGRDTSSLTFFYMTANDSSVGQYDHVYEKYFWNSNNTIYSYRDYDQDDSLLPLAVTVENGRAYVLAQVEFDIEPPSEYLLWTFDAYPNSFAYRGSSAEKSGYLADIAASGGRAFAVDEYSLHVYDVSDPANPVVEYTVETPGSPTGVATDGAYAYVAAGVPFFQTVDLSLPTNPNLAGSWDSYGLKSMAVQGKQVLATTGGSPYRLESISISNPSLPTSSDYTGLSETSYVTISGAYAFVTSNSGLKIFSFADPSNLSLTGSTAPISAGLGLSEVMGDYLYAVSRDGLQIFDIADPANPVGAGIFDSDPGGMNDVTVTGNRAYVTDGAYFQPNNLKIVDVSKPSAPTLIDKVQWGMTAGSVAVYKGYVYLSDWFAFGGVIAVDIDPSSGGYLTKYGPADTYQSGDSQNGGVAVNSGYAFVADSTEGLAILDVNAPAAFGNSSLLTTISWPGNDPFEVLLAGPYALVSDYTNGLIVIDLVP